MCKFNKIHYHIESNQKKLQQIHFIKFKQALNNFTFFKVVAFYLN